MPLIESMGDCDVWVSGISLIEEQWTKPEVFVRLGATDESIRKSPLIQGGFVLVRKSEMSTEFVSKWLELCSRPELLMPLEPNEPKGECIEHREDQSLLSVLCKLRGIKAHKPPCVLPKYYRLLHPKSELKKLVKKLLGIKPPVHKWAAAKSVKVVYEDTYSPCIYLHRIRKAGSVFSVVVQALRGMGPRLAMKFIAGCVKGLLC